MPVNWIQRARQGRSRFSGPSVGIFAATLVVSAAGLARESSVAAALGLGGQLDSLVTALSVMMLVGSALVSTAGAAVLPELARTMRAGDDLRTRDLVGSTILGSLVVGVLLGGVAFALAPPLAEWLSGAETAVADKVRDLLRVFAVIAIPLSAVRGALSAVLQAKETFVLPAGIQVVSSTFMAAAAFAIDRPAPRDLLSWFVLGLAVEVFILLAAATFRLAPRVPGHRGMATLLRPLVPRACYSLLATVVFGLNPVIDYAVANRLEPGSAAQLSLAGRIPLAAAAVVVAVIVTPAYTTMSEAYGAGGRSAVKEILRSRLRTSAQLGVATAVIVAVGGYLVARVLYGYGELGTSDASSIAVTQTVYALSIPFYVIGVLASRALFAADRQSLHLVIGVSGAIGNLILDIALGRLIGVNGIALATGLVYVLTLFWMLRAASTPAGPNPAGLC